MSMVAAVKGYKMIVVMPVGLSPSARHLERLRRELVNVGNFQ